MGLSSSLRKIYMKALHPVLSATFGKNLFVGQRSNIRNLNNIKIGKNVHFGNDMRIQSFATAPNIFIGDDCYFCHRDSILAYGKIQIGGGHPGS